MVITSNGLSLGINGAILPRDRLLFGTNSIMAVLQVFHEQCSPCTATIALPCVTNRLTTAERG